MVGVSEPTAGRVRLLMASSQKLLYDASAAVEAAANISDRRRDAMALPRVTTITADRAGRCLAAALLLLAALMPARLTSAQDQVEAFSATVKVDATADSAAAARDLARI